MEVPDGIATDMAKINFKKKVNAVEVCHVCAKEIWGRPSLLQQLKVHEGIQHQCDKSSYKTPTKKTSERFHRFSIQEYLLSVINERELLQRRVV